jgi:hypothetical protein
VAIAAGGRDWPITSSSDCPGTRRALTLIPHRCHSPESRCRTGASERRHHNYGLHDNCGMRRVPPRVIQVQSLVNPTLLEELRCCFPAL